MPSNHEPNEIEELPSRATKHKKQHATPKTGRSWFQRKKSNHVESAQTGMVQKSQEQPSDLAFYEALQSVREQAVAAAVVTAAPVPAADKPRWRLPSAQVMLVGLLGLSLVANLGEGFVIYKVMKMYAAEKNRYAIPQEEKQQPATQPEVSPVRQAVTWDEGQLSMLTKEERTGIESRLSGLLTPDVLQNGALNFVFVPGLNHLSAQHDGGVSFSAFFHNGFMKGYLPHQIKIKAAYEGRVILDRAFEQKFAEWSPSDVHLVEFAFAYDDVRDAKLLEELLHDTEKQQKIKFDVMMSYEKEKSFTFPDLKEEVWTFLNPHTLAEGAR